MKVLPHQCRIPACRGCGAYLGREHFEECPEIACQRCKGWGIMDAESYRVSPCPVCGSDCQRVFESGFYADNRS